MHAIRFGFLYALVLFIWTCLEYLAGFHQALIAYQEISSKLFLLPAFLLLFHGMRRYQRDQRYVMSFGEGLQEGIKTASVSAMLSPFPIWIYSAFINPGFFNTCINYTVDKGGMSREQAESFFSLQSYCIQSAAEAFVLGLIVALIGAWHFRYRESTQ